MFITPNRYKYTVHQGIAIRNLLDELEFMYQCLWVFLVTYIVKLDLRSGKCKS